MTKIMVVDDHPMWREGVARDLAEAGYDVIATAGEGAQAIRVGGSLKPEVMVLDLQLPDMSGVDVIKGVMAAHPNVRILVLSASAEHQDVLEAVKAGALGYLVKSAGHDEFLEAVRRTAEGDAVFTAGLAGLVLGEYRRLAAAPVSSGSSMKGRTARSRDSETRSESASTAQTSGCRARSSAPLRPSD